MNSCVNPLLFSGSFAFAQDDTLSSFWGIAEESCVSHVRFAHMFVVHVFVEPVFVLLLHVLVVLHVFVSLLLLLLHPHHPVLDDLFFHSASSVMSHVIGVEKLKALFALSHDKYRCKNLCDALVGSVGAVIGSL